MKYFIFALFMVIASISNTQITSLGHICDSHQTTWFKVPFDKNQIPDGYEQSKVIAWSKTYDELVMEEVILSVTADTNAYVTVKRLDMALVYLAFRNEFTVPKYHETGGSYFSYYPFPGEDVEVRIAIEKDTTRKDIYQDGVNTHTEIKCNFGWERFAFFQKSVDHYPYWDIFDFIPELKVSPNYIEQLDSIPQVFTIPVSLQGESLSRIP